MDIGRLSAPPTGRPGVPRSIQGADQHVHRHLQTYESARSPKSDGMGLRSSHAASMSTSNQQVAVNSSRDHTEPCSASAAKAAGLQAEQQSLRQKDDLRMALLGLCSLSVLHRQEAQPRYERTHRRWFGLRPGRLIVVGEQNQQQMALQRTLADAQGVLPVEVWTAVGGFLLAMLLQWVAVSFKGRALRRKRREEAQREALLQAQKASYRHRSRFQRALGSTSAEAPAAELDGEEYDGLPESNFSQPAHREEDFEIETEEEEEEEEPWEYDSEALKHWEQFVKKSKATQVSEANWWDMDAAASDDRAIAVSQEKRDWNA